MPPPPARRGGPRSPAPVLVLVLAGTLAGGWALGTALLGRDAPPPAAPASADLAAEALPPPDLLPGDVPGAGDAPVRPASPAPSRPADPPAPGTAPADPATTAAAPGAGAPSPERPDGGGGTAPGRAGGTTAARIPVPEAPDDDDAGDTTTTAAPPPRAPRVPEGPPPTVRIPAGAAPDAATARARLAAVRDAAPTGAPVRTDIDWLMRLDALEGGPGAPAGRRATVARALRANAWWYADRGAPSRRVVMRDADGVLLTYRRGRGFAVNPVATTGRWRGLNDDVPPEGLAEPLLQMGVERSGAGRSYLAWEYYDVEERPGAVRPGTSGMAQARVVELMATAYRRTGDPRFAEAAARGITALTVPVDEGGVRARVRLSPSGRPMLWFPERAHPGEDPWKGAALNGFMVTLLSLRKAGAQLDTGPAPAAGPTTGGEPAATVPGGTVPATTTAPAPQRLPAPPGARAASALAAVLARQGAESLRLALPAHDTGTWSLYGLLTPGRPPRTYLADLNYHCYHVHLLRALDRAYPGLAFAATADRWEGYVRVRGLTCPPR